MNKLMRNAFKFLLIASLLVNISYSQFSTSIEAWRVVFVSPNYPNIYPRYKTLQQTWNAIKDSASASTGKYYIVNIVTSVNNISDFTSGYKDSIINRFPYMALTAFGFNVQDTITGVNDNHFNLLSGILNLDPATAGLGLNFSSDKYNVNVITPLQIQNDSLWINLNDSNFYNPYSRNVVTLKRHTNSGIRYDASGLYLTLRAPLQIDNDTLSIPLSYYFTGSTDSLGIDWNDNHFNLIYGSSPSVNIKLDSGLTSGSDGIRAWLDNLRITFTSGEKITISNNTSGQGLQWIGDSLNNFAFNPLYYKSSLTGMNSDTLFLLYTNQMGTQTIGATEWLKVNTDSGLVLAPTSPLKLNIDYNTIDFNTNGAIKVDVVGISGNGLIANGNTIDVLPNDFLKLESDTLKAKTSTMYVFWGDSLTANMTNGLGVEPTDSTGLPMLKGNIKRVLVTYQLTSGNDTVTSQIQNVSFNTGDKFRIAWINGSSRWVLQKWTLALRTWVTQFNIDATGFANKAWSIILEAYHEAQ